MTEATEGGLGSGRKGHQGWMKQITEIKTNKHKIPQGNMKQSRFMSEFATENSMCGDCMDNFLIKATERINIKVLDYDGSTYYENDYDTKEEARAVKN